MFSGIISAVAQLSKVSTKSDNICFKFSSQTFDFNEINIGDSIAVNGACLTVVDKNSHHFSVDVSPETIRCTNLVQLNIGDLVNLEKVLTLNQGISGHLVSGHIDGVGTIKRVIAFKHHHIFEILIDVNWAKYCIHKGSICINGISLTINAIVDNLLSINIIPHTFKSTNLFMLHEGDKVNIEVDMMAKYIEKLCQ